VLRLLSHTTFTRTSYTAALSASRAKKYASRAHGVCRRRDRDGRTILLGPNANVAFLVALAFAVAASANLPVIVLSLFWKRFTTRGAVCGLGTGLVASILLIIIGPSIMGIDAPGATAAAHLIQARPIFPLENPGILSIPLGFVGAILGTLIGREPAAAAKYDELSFAAASTGIGAEKASGL
jgi:cation/acetate symporter